MSKTTNLFLIFNQPNYAWRMVKYHDNILQLDEYSHFKVSLENGFLKIKQFLRSFSWQLIDFALEQTMNADEFNSFQLIWIMQT